MPTVQDVRLHNAVTAHRGLQYEFTPKHHGCGGDAACWLTHITFDDELAIFDHADGSDDPEAGDREQVADADGNLYGFERLPDGSCRELGKRKRLMRGDAI